MGERKTAAAGVESWSRGTTAKGRRATPAPGRIAAAAVVLAWIAGASSAAGSPALVQTRSGANGGNDASITVSYAAPPAAGNLLVAIAGNRSSGGVTSVPAGWSVAIDQAGNSPGQIILYKVAGPAEPLAVTVEYSVSTRLGLHIYEYSGMSSGVGVDQVDSNSGSGATLTTGSVTTAGADELVIAAGVVNESDATFDSWSNSLVERNDFRNSGATSFQSSYGGADRVAAAPGVFSTTVALGGGGGTWRGQIVSFQSALNIHKRAFLADGTPLPHGATLPAGQRIRFLVYVNNRGAARADVSIRDSLEAAFGYQAGTIRIDNSMASCAADTCTAVEEAALYGLVEAAAARTDAMDGDVVSYDPGERTLDVGNQNAGNAQLDIGAGKVWAMLFEVKIR